MVLELIRTFLPEFVVLLAAVGVLLFEIVRPRSSRSGFVLTVLALGFAAVANGLRYGLDPSPTPHDVGPLRLDGLSLLFRTFISGGALLVALYAYPYLKERVKAFNEFCFLYLTAALGLMFVAMSANFLMFVVALETASLAMYVMAASTRSERASVEAGIKFFLNSAFATALMLWGISMLYGLSGTLDFDGVNSMLQPFAGREIKPFPLLGMLALITGVGFKITLFPFHLWAPDVYQGSPTPFTAFLATVSKAAGIAILIRIVVGPLHPLGKELHGLLGALAGFTMIAASTAALLQTNAKRLLAYSSISHAGFLIVGLTAMRGASDPDAALAATLFYMPVYILATAGAFIILYHIERHRKSSELTIFNGLWKTSPFLTLAMVVFLASLAGLPPTIGFVGKFFLFVQAYEAGMWMVLSVMVAATVVSLFFYFKIVRCMLLNDPEDGLDLKGGSPGPLVFLLMLAVLFLIFLSGPFYDMCVKTAGAL